jgi:HNH endonuclease
MTAISHGLCANHYGQHVRKHGKFDRISPEERFREKVNKNGPIPAYRPELGPCWIWQGAPKQEGYGTFYYEGRQQYAHRISYQWSVGPIPDGLQIDHLCRVHICVNPAHLEPVTNRENSLRGSGPRLTAERGRAVKKCKNGHEFTEENTYWSQRANGKWRRHCKQCWKDRTNRNYQRARDGEYTPQRHPERQKEVCKYGHRLSSDNLYISPSGSRHCRECRRTKPWRGAAGRRAR